MPHQCVRCGKLYADDAQEIMKGCSCGGRLFFFIKKERMEELKTAASNLSENDKQEIEKDIIELIGAVEDEMPPVVLDFESVRIMKPGKYELDLVRIFKDQPLVYKLDDGKYIIDIASAFESSRKELKGKKK